MAAKLDLKKSKLKHLYYPPADEVVRVDVPPLQFILLDGEGDPGGPAWAEAVGALYAVAYKIKFLSKQDGQDFTVMPLEGLWWANDMAQFSMDARDQWKWTGMILQPAHVTAAMFAAALEKAQASKKATPVMTNIRLETVHEGLAAQIMHIGPYAEEPPTIARLHAWIETQGCTYHGAGKHHEIYLSDPTRVAPEKMKTVLRQPMRPSN